MNIEKTLTHNVNTEVKITTPAGLVMFSQMGSNVIIHEDQIEGVIQFLIKVNELNCDLETENNFTTEISEDLEVTNEISNDEVTILNESEISEEPNEVSENPDAEI
jgi:hypothetical protein